VLGAKIPIVRGPCGYITLPIYEETTLVGIQGDTRQYREHALCCLSPTNQLRLAVIAIVDNVWFERISLLAVVSNCVLLAAMGPPSLAYGGPNAAFFSQADNIYTWLFTAELVLRTTAMGFVRDPR
jgi:hypothetical protein